MSKFKTRKDRRVKRHFRVRTKVSGTSNRPRVAVYKSLKYTIVQAIDDQNGKTVSYVTSQSLDKKLSKKDAAAEIGKIIGKDLLDKKIGEVVFDRGGYIYHGRVKAVAEAIREQGINL